MKTVLMAALVLSIATPSLAMAQDTARTARRVDKLVTPRRDSVRLLFADSILRFSRDSVRWLVADVRFDTARVPRDSIRWSPSLESGRATVPTLYRQNGNSPFAQHLFPPELVMQHQSRLKLTEQQRNTIVQEINRLQATAVQVQWRVADESEKLSELLSHDSVPEAAALEHVDKMIGFETAIKRAQLSMLIRIRNVLTAEQRAMLRSLQKPGE